jgi:hypothetical protein
MNEAAPTPGRRDAVFAFVTGLWLALLQFAYFFLLEVQLSSRAGAFFVVLFCWLVGFLAGLNAASRQTFPWLTGLAPLAYYLAYAVLHLRPYDWSVLPVVAASVAVGGALAGAFFPHMSGRFARVKMLLLHENNGYVTGLVLALLGSVFAGRALLSLAPAAGAVLVGAMMLGGRRSRS